MMNPDKEKKFGLKGIRAQVMAKVTLLLFAVCIVLIWFAYSMSSTILQNDIQTNLISRAKENASLKWFMKYVML